MSILNTNNTPHGSTVVFCGVDGVGGVCSTVSIGGVVSVGGVGGVASVGGVVEAAVLRASPEANQGQDESVVVEGRKGVLL